MVGTAMLLNLLHCKLQARQNSNNRLKKVIKKNRKASDDERLSVLIKPEIQDPQQNICRVCLREGNIPIYGDDGSREDVSEALNTFGGIIVQSDDGYPKFLCKACNSLLHGAILFRKTAQESDLVLKQPANDEDDTMVDDEPVPTTSYIDSDSETFEKMFKAQEGGKYHCRKCDVSFATFAEFCEHRASTDHEERRRTCPICNKSYAALYLKTHLALHKQETSYMCDICGKKFIIRGQFTRHRLTHFVDNLPFKCDQCPYRGRFSESLKMHMKTHTGEKTYQCSQCAHRFVNKSNLNRHLLTHKGKHDYICASCGRGYYTKRDLELHLKVDHAGIKDHVCNICGKAFGYRKQMMKHQLKVHRRQKLRSGRTPLYLIAESKMNYEESTE